MNIGDTVTVSYEESKKLRKEGWRPRNDVVVMMYVGHPQPPSIHERGIRGRWTQADHDLADRKMAEESKPLVIKRKHRRRRRVEAVQ